MIDPMEIHSKITRNSDLLVAGHLDIPHLRVVFMGSPEYACPSLRALHNHPLVKIVAVYTQPPRPKGRHHEMTRTPVHTLALELDLPVYHPVNFKAEEEVAIFKALQTDLALVVAYGLLLPKFILDAPRLGCINAHGSILPRWRGAAPIQRAIAAGDSLSGVSIMTMDEGFDTGDVLSYWPYPIDSNTTASTLHDALAVLSATSLIHTIESINQGSMKTYPQAGHGVTHAHKVMRREGLLDFRCSAWDLDYRIRAFNPSPGTWFFHNKEEIKILQARALCPIKNDIYLAVGQWHYHPQDGLFVGCGYGVLQVDILQRSNKKPLPAQDFLNGYRGLFV